MLVLAYPSLSKQDLDWIQQIRSVHDQRYFHIFAPHFTLVFPAPDSLLNHVQPHVEAVATKLHPISFVLRSALVVKDSFSDFTGVFLVPDEGFGNIVRAHDVLYTGILEEELRLDVPFIPHIGIANYLSPQTCKRLANEINQCALTINGMIDNLDVVTWERSAVHTVARCCLSG